MIDTSLVKKVSKKVGIDLCGITDNGIITDRIFWLKERLDKGHGTEFEEKNIEARINPLKTMETCRSIIVVALSYGVETTSEVDFRLRGKLSKSSWGYDYHLVLRNKIDMMVEELLKIGEFSYKTYVDTGPLIDRDLANKSGIGYFGKNCSIINEDYGSYIFIGYILTDLDLEIDKPVEGSCGTCNLCIKACPTGALGDDYRLNSRKCISYLSQTRNIIPKDLRPKMGIKIYGCDTCQDVCPKNKDIKKPNHSEFIPENGGYIDIEDLMTISNKEFKEKYSYMAGAWRGKNILKRNGIIALGNMKTRDNLNILENQLKNDSLMIREYTKWAIKNINLYDKR